MRKFLLVMFFTMFPVLAHGATYYVAKTGSNSNSCANAQSQSTPKLTINAGAGCLSAGDTLIVKSGTYNEVLRNVIPSGTAGNPTIVRSEVQYGAIIQPGAGNQANLYDTVGAVTFKDRNYITFDGFTMNGTGLSGVMHIYLIGTSVNYITIQNNDIGYGADNTKMDNSMGIAGGHNSTFITVRNNKIHDIGTGASSGKPFYAYGMYNYFNDSLVENNEIWNCSGYGMHFYNTITGDNSRNVIRNNRVHHNGIPSFKPGILVAAGGKDNLVYSNILYSNGYHGIQVGGYGVASLNNMLYNNTIYNNTGPCIQLGSPYQGPSGTIVRNNICYQNGSDTIRQDLGTGTVMDHNLLGTNPGFVNAAAHDFHLQAGSPAIDAGVVVPGLSYNDSAPDLGAIESGAGGQPKAPSNLRRLVEN